VTAPPATATQEPSVTELHFRAVGPQIDLISCPIEDVFYGGARGGMKSYGIILDFVAHADQYGRAARGIIFRRSYDELVEIERICHEVLGGVWRWKASGRTWTSPKGATLKLRYLDRDEDAARYQGHQHTRVYVDEAGAFANPRPIDLLFGTLRSPEGVPVGRRLTGNPGGPGHCLPPETDVLTRTGWCPIADVLVGQDVATLDDDEVLVFRPVEQLHHAHYRGPLLTVENATSTIRCTPNHHIARRTETKRSTGRTWHPISFVRADALSQVTHTIRAATHWVGVTLGEVELPRRVTVRRRRPQPLRVTGDDYAALAGWMVSEGWTLMRHRRHGSCGVEAAFGIAQCKPEGRAAIRALLTRIGFRFRENATGFVVASVEWCQHWRDEVGLGCRSKRIPSALRGASRDQLRRFWEAAMLGDGCDGVYYTISSQLADDMMDIGLKLGFAPRMTFRQRLDRAGLSYEIRFRDGRDGWVERRHVTYAPYDGPVYCLGIAGLHRFFVRQQGTIWLSGNSWLKQRYVDPSAPWKPFKYQPQPELQPDLWLTAVFIPATLEDNPFLMRKDPGYVARLAAAGGGELFRAWRYGHWDITGGAALEIVPAKHIVRPFPQDIPEYFRLFGAFDWGYAHWWVFAWFAVNEDGRVFCMDTIRGRRMRDPEIITDIKRRVPCWERLGEIVAGHDCWNVRNMDQDAPTTFERFADAGLYLRKASTDRIMGLRNFREYLAWKGTRPDGQDDDPRFVWVDTKGNRRAVAAIQAIVMNPDNPEDALKVDADRETGAGGDDDYDCTRYGLASRPLKAKAPWPEKRINVFAPEVLAYEADESRRDRAPKPNQRQVLPEGF
jgi:hypothetical protein